MTSRRSLDILPRGQRGRDVGRLLWNAIRAGLWGLLLVPLFGLLFVFGLMIFDPKCGSPGDSGGCAMGLVTVPAVLVVPGFATFFGLRLLRDLWTLRPRDWGTAIRRLRTWGRED
jgi:hypothetical protein